MGAPKFYYFLNFVFSTSFLFLFTSCSSLKKINNDFLYFQKGSDSTSAVILKAPIIQLNDLLNIQIFSKTLNQDQASVFNIPNNSGGNVNGYLVSMNGTVELPLIGEIQAAGLTRAELQAILIQKLTPYVKDPSVLVRFLQFKVNVLGEVHTPGTKNFQTDGVTIIDAISAAGDLTDFGKRHDVLVIREAGGNKVYYTVNLNDRNLFQSPAYQLQQNDIVYVGATTDKLKGLNTNTQKTLQLGGAIISSIAVLVGLITIITR